MGTGASRLPDALSLLGSVHPSLRPGLTAHLHRAGPTAGLICRHLVILAWGRGDRSNYLARARLPDETELHGVELELLRTELSLGA